mgnify:CR=1 FL=1
MFYLNSESVRDTLPSYDAIDSIFSSFALRLLGLSFHEGGLAGFVVRMVLTNSRDNTFELVQFEEVLVLILLHQASCKRAS